jgi:hypothetical protein
MPNRLVRLRATENRGGEECMITINVDAVGGVMDRRGFGCLVLVQGEPFYCDEKADNVVSVLHAAGWGGRVRQENKGVPK